MVQASVVYVFKVITSNVIDKVTLEKYSKIMSKINYPSVNLY